MSLMRIPSRPEFDAFMKYLRGFSEKSMRAITFSAEGTAIVAFMVVAVFPAVHRHFPIIFLISFSKYLATCESFHRFNSDKKWHKCPFVGVLSHHFEKKKLILIIFFYPASFFVLFCRLISSQMTCHFLGI